MLKEDGARRVIGLEGVAGIEGAPELKKLLVGALGSGKEVRVSVEGATDLDVTVIELLWAAAREAKAASVGFALEGQVPATVALALAGAGFHEFPVPGEAG